MGPKPAAIHFYTFYMAGQFNIISIHTSCLLFFLVGDLYVLFISIIFSLDPYNLILPAFNFLAANLDDMQSRDFSFIFFLLFQPQGYIYSPC